MSLEQLVKDWDPLLAQLLPGSSPLHRAAIWGQMGQESGCKPDAISGDGGHGLLQWTGSRWNQLQAFANGLGKPWTDIETQIRFLGHELATTEAHAWTQTQKTTSPDAAAETFMLDFERPAAATANLKRRINDTYAALAVIQAAQPGAKPVVDTPTPTTQPNLPAPTNDPTVNGLAEWIISNEVGAEQVIKGLLVARGIPGFAVDFAFSIINPILNQAIQNIHPDDIAKGVISLVGNLISQTQKKAA